MSVHERADAVAVQDRPRSTAAAPAFAGGESAVELAAPTTDRPRQNGADPTLVRALDFLDSCIRLSPAVPAAETVTTPIDESAGARAAEVSVVSPPTQIRDDTVGGQVREPAWLETVRAPRGVLYWLVIVVATISAWAASSAFAGSVAAVVASAVVVTAELVLRGVNFWRARHPGVVGARGALRVLTAPQRLALPAARFALYILVAAASFTFVSWLSAHWAP
jgi:hypothetical protein